MERLPPKIEFELYSICLELVNNILKHSKATQAQINLSAPALRGSDRAADRPNRELKLMVSDNGIGFFENDSDGKGIKNVRARVESLNGTWKIKNSENQGITNTISIPL
ncbi:sensor histidine kinase [Runella sp. SP2]|uniref:sensor histidine kinase n=1 Tax=Runella sp. SP2 TaxID=2268026 RepID=UPI0013DDC6B7|nr:ATP-binding protein [Runella sp. SP2]